MRVSLAAALACLVCAEPALAQSGLNVLAPNAGTPPPPVTVDSRRFDAIEPLVREAIADKKLPGAVVLVGRRDRILYQKAFGHRASSPSLETMTTDTIFDLASLTKVVATTTSVMILV